MHALDGMSPYKAGSYGVTVSYSNVGLGEANVSDPSFSQVTDGMVLVTLLVTLIYCTYFRLVYIFGLPTKVLLVLLRTNRYASQRSAPT